MRNDDYSNRYQGQFTLSSDISTRDRDGVNKTFSGMMKLLFPADNATEAEVEEILHLAMEGRKRVRRDNLDENGASIWVRRGDRAEG